jgi:hypothetical protein
MSAAPNTLTPPTQHRFIEPLDVLFLRGNKLFGDPGSHGESLVPPWPSAAAGALRSQLLGHDGIDLTAFAQSRINHPSLGTPQVPGSFALTAFIWRANTPTATSTPCTPCLPIWWSAKKTAYPPQKNTASKACAQCRPATDCKAPAALTKCLCWPRPNAAKPKPACG